MKTEKAKRIAETATPSTSRYPVRDPSGRAHGVEGGAMNPANGHSPLRPGDRRSLAREAHEDAMNPTDGHRPLRLGDPRSGMDAMTPTDGHRPLRSTGETVALAEFARSCGVHEETARRWVRAGLILARRTPTGRIRVLASEVERWCR